MPYYTYRAIDSNSATVEGILEAQTTSQCYEILAQLNLSPIKVKKASTFLVTISNKLQARKISRKDIIELASNLSIMLKAGVPLLTALNDIGKSVDNKMLSASILEIAKQTEMGLPFSDALSLKRAVIPDIMIKLVKIGEETGRLDKSLADIAEHLQKIEDLASAIKRALIYPIFSLVTTLGALIFWLAYVLPKIVAILKEMGVTLPLMTRLLIYISEFFQKYWFLLPIIPIGTFTIITVLKRKEVFRYFFDYLKLKLPIISLIVHNKLLAVFSEQMRIMVVAGIPIIRSLSVCADALNNAVFKRAITETIERVSAGERISESLKKYPIFPSIVTRMVDIGESSGSLDEQFRFLSEYYLKKLDDISEKIGKLIEPIIIAVMGLMFALIVIGLMFPLYELISKVGK